MSACAHCTPVPLDAPRQSAYYMTCGISNGADQFLVTLVFFLWISLCAWPVLLFYMPMVYGTRVDEDWGRSRIFGELQRKESLGCGSILGLLCGEMVPVGRTDNGATPQFAYQVSRLPPQIALDKAVEIPAERCWGDNTKWLSSWWCACKALGAMCGMYADCLKAVCLPCCPPPCLTGNASAILVSIAAVRAYIHLLLWIAYSNLRRLVLMACGVTTEELFVKYELLERAAKVSSRKDAATHHEEVTSLNAKLHGLYWLFLPGCAMLAKMTEYLNEFAVLFVVGDAIKEVDCPSKLLTIESYVVDSLSHYEIAPDAPADAPVVPLPNGRALVLTYCRATGSGRRYKVTRIVDDPLGASLYPEATPPTANATSSPPAAASQPPAAASPPPTTTSPPPGPLPKPVVNPPLPVPVPVVASPPSPQTKPETASMPVARPVQPVTQPAALPVAQPVTQPVALPVAQPVVFQPVAQAAVSPRFCRTCGAPFSGGAFCNRCGKKSFEPVPLASPPPSPPSGGTELTTGPGTNHAATEGRAKLLSGMLSRRYRDVRVELLYVPDHAPSVKARRHSMTKATGGATGAASQRQPRRSTVLRPAPAERLQMTVRIIEPSERCVLLNDRLFYRDSRTGKRTCGADRGVRCRQLLWLLGVCKFAAFFFATVGLSVDASGLASRMGLTLCALPVFVQHLVRAVSAFIDRVQTVQGVRTLLADAESAVSEGLAQVTRALASLKDEVAPFVAQADFLDALHRAGDAVSATEELAQLAARKYNCAIPRESLAEMRRTLERMGADAQGAASDAERGARAAFTAAAPLAQEVGEVAIAAAKDAVQRAQAAVSDAAEHARNAGVAIERAVPADWQAALRRAESEALATAHNVMAAGREAMQEATKSVGEVSTAAETAARSAADAAMKKLPGVAAAAAEAAKEASVAAQEAATTIVQASVTAEAVASDVRGKVEQLSQEVVQAADAAAREATGEAVSAWAEVLPAVEEAARVAEMLAKDAHDGATRASEAARAAAQCVAEIAHQADTEELGPARGARDAVIHRSMKG